MQTVPSAADAGGRLLFETDTAGRLTAVNIFCGLMLVARGDGAGNWRFPLCDKTFNVIAVTDEAGSVQGSFAYTPHGVKTASDDTGTWPYTYVGGLGVVDEGDGIYFMRNRYYDSVTGRFLQRDPLGIADNINLYRYAGNNPVINVDPAGTFPIALVGALKIISTAVTIGAAVIGTAAYVVQNDKAVKLDRQARFKLKEADYDRNLAKERRQLAAERLEMAKTESCSIKRAEMRALAAKWLDEAEGFDKRAGIEEKLGRGISTDADDIGNESGKMLFNTATGAALSLGIGATGAAIGVNEGIPAAIDIGVSIYQGTQKEE